MRASERRRQSTLAHGRRAPGCRRPPPPGCSTAIPGRSPRSGSCGWRTDLTTYPTRPRSPWPRPRPRSAVVHDISDPFFAAIAAAASGWPSSTTSWSWSRAPSASRRSNSNPSPGCALNGPVRSSWPPLVLHWYAVPNRPGRTARRVRRPRGPGGGDRRPRSGRRRRAAGELRRGSAGRIAPAVAGATSRSAWSRGRPLLATVADRLGGFTSVIPRRPSSRGLQPRRRLRGGPRLLSAHPHLTAIFALDDLMAFGVLAAARDLGPVVRD